MQPRVVITHRIRHEIIEMLSHSFVVVPNMATGALSGDELLRRSKDAQAIVVGTEHVIAKEFLDQCPKLKIIAATSNDSGRVDVHACTDHGVWFSVVKYPSAAPVVVELEAAANIIEALSGERPECAVNLLRLRRRITREYQKSRRSHPC